MTAGVARLRTLPIWQPLAIRPFRLLWASEVVSMIGDQFQYIALSWLVISLTGSGFALGTVLIAVGVPRALLIVPFGVVADRRPPRQLMLAAHIGRGVVVGAMAALVVSGQATIPLIVALSTLFGIADALYLPTLESAIPRMVEPAGLQSANALVQGTLQLTSFVGPPIAGAVIAIVGTGSGFVVNAMSFFVAASIVALISAPSGLARPSPVLAAKPVAGDHAADAAPAASHAKPAFRAQLREGFAYVAHDPAIRMLMLIALVLNLAFNGPVEVGMAWLANNRFGAGPAGLGLLLAGWGVGALVGTLAAGNIGGVRQGRLVMVAITVAGAGLAVIGLIPALPLLVLLLAVMGVAVGYTNIVAITWLQARVETALLGRVMSLVMLMSFGITPLSLGLAGALIDLDAAFLFGIAGALILLVAAFAAATGFPRMIDEPAAGAAETPAAG